MRDILIEFFNDPPSDKNNSGDLATMVKHKDTDAEPGGMLSLDVD